MQCVPDHNLPHKNPKSENRSLSTRSYALPQTFAFNLLQASNFVIGLYFLSVVNKFGISTVYLGFALVCTLAVMYIAGSVVETKGRSLEEIERALSPALAV